MIISLRGTNGAGKSTIVRKILNQYPIIKALMLPNKIKPAGYFCELEEFNHRRLFVPGHYEEGGSSGLDTYDEMSTDDIYKRIMYFHSLGLDILFEGKNWTDRNMNRLIWMDDLGIDIKVIFIDYPLDKCIKAVRIRGHRIKEDTIIKLYNNCTQQLAQLQKANIACYHLTRDDSLYSIQKWLNLPTDIKPDAAPIREIRHAKR